MQSVVNVKLVFVIFVWYARSLRGGAAAEIVVAFYLEMAVEYEKKNVLTRHC